MLNFVITEQLDSRQCISKYTFGTDSRPVVVFSIALVVQTE